MTLKEMMEQLEPMIDATDLASVILALARVCDEKAEHIEIEWQDRVTARPWRKASRMLDKSTIGMAI